MHLDACIFDATQLHGQRGAVFLRQTRRFLVFFENHISDQTVPLKLKIYAFVNFLWKLVLQNRAPRKGGEHIFEKNMKNDDAKQKCHQKCNLKHAFLTVLRIKAWSR